MQMRKALRGTDLAQSHSRPSLHEITPDESGRAELYAIPGRFGSLASTEIVVGAPNESGTRPNFALETPAENSYVYDGLTCPS